MIANKIKDVLKRYKKIHPEDYISTEKIWDEETEILSRDMAVTIDFIENDCDDETFYWLGEVFEDVAERTQSREFITAIKKRAAKVIDAQKRRSIETDISYAEDRLFALIGEELKPILEKRKLLAGENKIKLCLKKASEILSREMADTVYFFETDCDDETFYWLGEVFEDVAERTQSREFITAIKKRAAKVIDAQKRRSVEGYIIFAENKLTAEIR